MFIRIKRGGSREHPHDYLQIVEAYRPRREDGRLGHPKQRVVANLGRLDTLLASRQLDGLIAGLARFSEGLRVLGDVRGSEVQVCRSKLWGPALVFGRLWEQQGIDRLLRRLAEGRRFGFHAERAAFALALQRLCCRGSALQGSPWATGVEAPGFEALEPQHFCRTAAWLGAVRGEVERELFLQDRDRSSGEEAGLLFINAASLYAWRGEQTARCRRGDSRERRPELPQPVLAVAVDRRGWPAAWEVLPGGRVDRKAFEAVVELLRSRLRVRRAIMVADRGMVSKEALAAMADDAEAPFGYILGCRMRHQKEVGVEALARGGRSHRLAEGLQAKEVWVGGRRCVVCINREEARRDAAARSAILAHLEEALAREPKALMGNKGARRFLRARRGGAAIDQEAVEKDARLDGRFVLRTNTELPAEEVATAYKGLWRVERTFREERSTLGARPLSHDWDPSRMGHVVASFLALRLEVDLQQRLDERGVDAAWPDLMEDLSRVEAVRLTLDGKTWNVRTDLVGKAPAAFEAAGILPPERLTPVGAEGSM